jgi:crotonobetainyl-CoA:carnitine CoA-transferase CaiB-like acyl-CoA transferase
MGTENMQALAGLRVLDLCSGPAGGIATMILADFGAEVIMIERPEATDDEFLTLPAAPMWRRGKQYLQLDLADDADHERLQQLAAAADIFICNWRPSALQRRGLDFDTMHSAHPHLIYCHISGFGSRGPLAELPGYEHAVAAYSGRMQLFRGLTDRPGPVFSAVQVGVHASAQSAVAGILAAVLDRGNDGRGRLVETSLLQGMLPYEMGAMLGQQLPQHFPDLQAAFAAPSPEPPLPTLYYHPAQAGDGRWMQFGNLLPHLFDNFLINTDLIDIIADPDFDPKQLLVRDRDKQEAFRERMLKRIQERPADAWMNQLIEDGGVVSGIYQTTQEALSDPDIVANGHVIERADGVQIGPLARMSRTPAQPGTAARPGVQLADAWVATPRITTSNENTELPLAGVKIVELATIIAAPIGASFLADMGAEVIKVEQIGGDPFRGMLSGLGSARVNAGKHSISVNLKTAAGRDLVLRLCADADALIHNYRPGVPERLGIGYEQVAAINPDIVYLQSNGYGPDGPSALRPSTHPIPGAAMGGVVHQMGGSLPGDLQDFEGLKLWTSRLMRANELNPDPNTGLVVASSVMLGLVARQRTGQGQQIFVDMYGANAYANSDDFLHYPGKADRALPDRGLHGLSAIYRLYPCDAEQWLFVALLTDRQRHAFIDTLAAAGHPAPDLAALQSPDDVLAERLSALLATKSADYWQALLAPAGVACVRADGTPPSTFWLQDEQARAMQLTAPVDHPVWGPYRRHGPLVMFDGECQTLGPAPTAGQHNQEILFQLGYSQTQVDEFREQGVIWQEDI